MPTAARLTGAIMFGIASWIYIELSTPYFPEAQLPPYWSYMPFLVGVVLGWTFAGSRAGNGYPTAFANGLTTGFGILFWAYFIMSFLDMIERSLRRDYAGPFEAILSVFDIMINWVEIFFIPSLLTTFAIVCVIAGFFVEFIGRRYS